MKTLLKNLWNDHDAATAIEYGLLMAAIAISLVLALSAFGDGLTDMFDYVSDSVDDEVP